MIVMGRSVKANTAGDAVSVSGGRMCWMLVVLIAFTGCSRGTVTPPPGPVGRLSPDRSTAQPVAMPAHKLTAGEVLFLRHCAGCHGAGARGDGPVGTAMGLRPRNLREAGLFPEERDAAWIVRILHGKAMPVSMQSSSTIALSLIHI